MLGIEVEGLSRTVKAKRGPRLPVVLSVPETAALLGAMRGTTVHHERLGHRFSLCKVVPFLGSVTVVRGCWLRDGDRGRFDREPLGVALLDE